jgi:DNA-directed RNA polymerase specialized sigma subunit
MNLGDFVCGDADRKIEAEQAIEKLGHIDRAVLYLWVEGYTQAEIGVIFGYSQQRISQIIADISKKREL